MSAFGSSPLEIACPCPRYVANTWSVGSIAEAAATQIASWQMQGCVLPPKSPWRKLLIAFSSKKRIVHICSYQSSSCSLENLVLIASPALPLVQHPKHGGIRRPAACRSE